jgi:regulator of sigma E protease
MDYLIYFILTIGILVFIHELGHYLAAKICRIRTDVFAIGFGKRLIGWNRINGFSIGALPKDIDLQGYTDYRISLLPLGGYVKIVGMIDESFDTKFAKEEPKPYEFRSKPMYQKLFVITAGVLMNLLLTLFIFAGINFLQGKQVYMTTTAGKINEQSLAYEAGFRSGDKILEVNGVDQSDWEGLLSALLMEDLGQSKQLKVLRDGAEVEFTADGKILTEAIRVMKDSIFLPLGESKPMITSVADNKPAQKAGILPKDIFLKIDGRDIPDINAAIETIKSSEAEMQMTLLRGGDTVQVAVTASENNTIGIGLSDVFVGKVEYRNYSIWESLSHGFSDMILYTEITFTAMGSVIRGDIEFGDAFRGPVGIAEVAADSADLGLLSFLKFIAVLSLSLAIINILPFPAMDGGHFVIIVIEGIIRRELPLRLKIAIQNAGFILLLLLMAFILYNDIVNL